MCRVLVICGGESSERAVSLEGGRAVSDALAETGYTVGIWDPAISSSRELNPSDWDVAFPMLHGTGGEDGLLHKELQKLGIPWVGCSIAGSALTFDKSLTRDRMQQHGIRVAPGRTISASNCPAPDKYPVVVKPAREGSSVGVSVVHCDEDWAPAIRTALALCSEVVVEAFIAGREVSVPVIHGEIFPAVEIIVAEGWYDYRNKYETDTTTFKVMPGDLPPDVGEVALQACKACNADGVLRVDFRLDNRGRLFLLEINSIPGMTSHSLVPMSAAAAGFSLSALCDRCVRHRLSSLT